MILFCILSSNLRQNYGGKGGGETSLGVRVYVGNKNLLPMA